VEADPTLPSLPQNPGESVYSYDRYAFERQMPKLRTENPEVRAYLLNVAKYWIEHYGIDGWRLDVANEIEHDFWREFRRAVRSIKPDVFILGEVWHDSLPWLMGDQFDSVMNYPFPGNAIDFVLGKMSADEFRKSMTRLLMAYPASVNQNLFNLIGSHDTERIMNKLGFDEKKLRMLLALEFTFIGTPCIYYGDEIGLDGEFDPGCRKCMPWETIENQKEAGLLNFHRQMIKMRKENSALFSSSLQFVEVPHNLSANLVAYVRRLDAAQKKEGDVMGAEKIIVLANNSASHSVSVDLKDPAFGVAAGARLRHVFQNQTYADVSEQQTSKRQRVSRSRSLLISHELGSNEINTAQTSTNSTLEMGPFEFVILSEEPAVDMSNPTHQNSVA
jgi:glycosidase